MAREKNGDPKQGMVAVAATPAVLSESGKPSVWLEHRPSGDAYGVKAYGETVEEAIAAACEAFATLEATLLAIRQGRYKK